MSHVEKFEAVVKWGAVALYIGGFVIITLLNI